MKSNAEEQATQAIIESPSVVVTQPEVPMTVARPSAKVLAEAQEAARALAQVIAGKKRKVIFGGEQSMMNLAPGSQLLLLLCRKGLWGTRVSD